MSLRFSRRSAGLLAAFVAASQLAFAGPAMQAPEKNIEAQHQDASAFFSSLLVQPLISGLEPVGRGADPEYIEYLKNIPLPDLKTADFDEFSADPQVEARVVAGAALWSAIAARTMGSSSSAAQTQMLARYGTELSRSKAPVFRSVGASLLGVADAVNRNDAPGAWKHAQAVRDTPIRGFDPKATLGGRAKSFMDDFEKISGWDWGQAFYALNVKAGIAFIVGFIQGGLVGAVIAAVVSCVGSLINGEFTATTTTYKDKRTGKTRTVSSANANSAQGWVTTGGAALLGGQVGRAVNQGSGARQESGVYQKAGAPSSSSQAGSGASVNTEIKPEGGSADGNVLPGSK